MIFFLISEENLENFELYSKQKEFPKKMSSASKETVKRPFKTRSEALGWLFGDPIDSFANHISVTSTPASAKDYSFCPTKQNIVQHWMACIDKTRNSYHSPDKNAIIGEVVDNLITFWTNSTTGFELR